MHVVVGILINHSSHCSLLCVYASVFLTRRLSTLDIINLVFQVNVKMSYFLITYLMVDDQVYY